LKGKMPTGSLLLGGVLLLLIISFMFITNTYPIGLSKNALSRVQSSGFEFEITGDIAWDGESGLYQYGSRNTLKKFDFKGKPLWEKNLEGRQLVWMGQGGFLTYRAKSVEMWDSDGKLLFEKTDFMELPLVLSAEGDFLLISGKIEQRDCTALLSKKGSLMWVLAWEGSVVSGFNTGSGLYSILNLVDKDICGRMVLVDSLGKIVWDKRLPNLLLCTRATGEGIAAIAEDRAFLLDFTGNVIWEHFFEQKGVYRADICGNGYASVVVEQRKSVLSNKDRLEIMMFSPEGQVMWSYMLKIPPRFVKIAGDFVYIADDEGITVLSKQGLLEYSAKQKGVRGIEVVDSSRIIVKRGVNSGLLEISGGR
jgi:outer membrane protein assembly factor BamB